MSKPSIPQGTRDFSPEVVRKRQYILNTLKTIFELYGFQPLETPAMENLTTLTGKYGEEGDRLIFKILNNGLHDLKDDKRTNLDAEWHKVTSRPYSSPVVTERALRYDLTIPFARYVAMNQRDIAFPFRRYQMQPVWRADRPQKGRYREFWQCDADVVGSTSLINEAELLCIYQQAFVELNVPFEIQINSRKILEGIAELCGHSGRIIDLTIALDKLDKIGLPGVKAELIQKGFDEESIKIVFRLLGEGGSINVSNEGKLNELKIEFEKGNSDRGLEGVKEIEQVLEYYKFLSNYGENIGMEVNNGFGVQTVMCRVIINISLARGLNYYTGLIVEVVARTVEMGSIGGGGRYDNLTGLFGVYGFSGVGVSFGIDRIYDVMEELEKNGNKCFRKDKVVETKVILIDFIEINKTHGLSFLRDCRLENIIAELYPDAAKFEKQMRYATQRKVRYVVAPCEDDLTGEFVRVRNLGADEKYFTKMKREDAIILLKNS